MVKFHTVDDHEVCKVVLVGGVVSMPGHDVKGGKVLQDKKGRSIYS